MAQGNIADLIKICSRDGLQKYSCYYHPGTSARGICSRCGRDLCQDCFLASGRQGLCHQCRRSLLPILSTFRTRFFNPLSMFVLVIALFSLVYFSLTRGQVNIIGNLSPNSSSDKKDIALRNRLYLGKGIRLKLYADYLVETKKPRLAERSYHRARLALEQVLQGTEKEFAVSLADSAKKISEKPVRQRLAGLLISIAACYRGQGQISQAINTLHKSLEIEPEPETAGLAYYQLGRIYEEEKEDYREAVSMYKAAQGKTAGFTDFLGNMLDSLSKPASERRTSSVVQQLAGSYDPAEAQFRVITCYRELGLTDKVIEEYNALLEQYPFSEWTAEAQKADGIPGIREELEPETNIEIEMKPEETLTIVPLEE